MTSLAHVGKHDESAFQIRVAIEEVVELAKIAHNRVGDADNLGVLHVGRRYLIDRKRRENAREHVLGKFGVEDQ